jgi:hypothetical protein
MKKALYTFKKDRASSKNDVIKGNNKKKHIRVKNFVDFFVPGNKKARHEKDRHDYNIFEDLKRSLRRDPECEVQATELPPLPIEPSEDQEIDLIPSIVESVELIEDTTVLVISVEAVSPFAIFQASEVFIDLEESSALAGEVSTFCAPTPQESIIQFKVDILKETNRVWDSAKDLKESKCVSFSETVRFSDGLESQLVDGKKPPPPRSTDQSTYEIHAKKVAFKASMADCNDRDGCYLFTDHALRIKSRHANWIKHVSPHNQYRGKHKVAYQAYSRLLVSPDCGDGAEASSKDEADEADNGELLNSEDLDFAAKLSLFGGGVKRC